MTQTSLQIDETGFMVGSVYTLCHSFNCPGLGRAVRWSFISEQTAFSTNITPSSPYPTTSHPPPHPPPPQVNASLKSTMNSSEICFSEKSYSPRAKREDLIGKSVCEQYPGHSELMHCQQTESFCT
ncbi:hypothetical protein NQZ68_029301 [Dissostichus eleginoides]|nr:hypothetical protein NQZ68_029301 [Dissostichus eleginoides]